MTTPDYTEALPALLSARAKSVDAGSRGMRFDVTLAGVGFVLAPSPQSPYRRETAEVQKQQIDTSGEAGEQTLDGLWTRSQTSWHRGAGADFYEPGSRVTEIDTTYRFHDSRGVDVWTQGRLSLLRKTDLVEPSAGAVAAVGAYDPTDGDVWFSYTGTTLTRHSSTDDDYTATDADPAYGLVNAGSVVLMGGTLGVRQAPVSGGAATNLWTQSLDTGVRPYWVKSRVGMTKGPEMFFGSLAGGAIGTDITAHWTHPDDSWAWTGMAEAPDAILASGHAGGRSAVFAMVMTEDSGGSVPKLSQPFQVAEFPTGETVTAIRSYLGRYLGIGTNRGLRVGLIGTGGQIQYGPLLVETDDPVVSIDARGDFFYAATGSRVIRVSLAEPIGDGLRFAYASDVETDDTITSLSFFGGRLLAACAGAGVYLESDSEYVAEGWLQSGRVRYGTTAPKSFRTIDVVCSTTATDSVSVGMVLADTLIPRVSLSQGASGVGLSLAALPNPSSDAAPYLTLRSTDGSTSPTVDAVALRAYPVPRRQRYVQFPLLLADELRSSSGVPYGWTGYASDVLTALEELENTQAVVQVEDRTRPERFEASIEKVQMVRTEPRAGNGAGNFGGVLQVTVKTL